MRIEWRPDQIFEETCDECAQQYYEYGKYTEIYHACLHVKIDQAISEHLRVSRYRSRERDCHALLVQPGARWC